MLYISRYFSKSRSRQHKALRSYIVCYQTVAKQSQKSISVDRFLQVHFATQQFVTAPIVFSNTKICLQHLTCGQMSIHRVIASTAVQPCMHAVACTSSFARTSVSLVNWNTLFCCRHYERQDHFVGLPCQLSDARSDT